MNTGIKITYIAISINLIIAAIMVLVLSGTFSNFLGIIIIMRLELGAGILGLYLSGYVIGNKMEYLISQRHWNSVYTGIAGAFLVLFCGVLCGSSVGFLQDGIARLNEGYELKYALRGYLIIPFFWIFLFGFIPTIIVGGITGHKIEITCSQNG